MIRKFKKQPTGSKEFEKMEMIFSDFRIYTHRPGAMKIKRLSDNKQLAVIGDKLKIKYYNNSKDLVNLEKLSETKTVLKISNVPVLTWDLRTVKKHQANFYQVMGLGTKPFHYYIVLYNKNKTIALNYSHFDRQIEKSIDKELIISSMESAIQKAAYSKFGFDNEIEATIDREKGSIKIQKVLQIVEKVEDASKEITLKDASELDKNNQNLKVGDKIYEELPQVDFGRIAAQSAKQVISQRVKEAEKTRQFNDFIEKQGQILSGIIKRLEYGNVIVDLGRAEGIIRKEELIQREILKNGDRVKAYCYEVKRDNKGHQIFLSRAHPQFLARLFFQEVPEIYEGTIEIKAVARDPGSRAKICVNSKDSSLDPVGACVGMRGSRVQAVVNELQGEKIDIVNWSDDLAIVAANALSPAEILRVNVDSTQKKIDVILTDENLSKAIGRRGQNVRLATKLLGHEINILTDQEESERRQLEFKEKTDNFVKNLELDETLGQLLVAEGFSNIEDIKDSQIENLTKIEGIDDNTAKELINRSKEFYQKDQEEISKRVKNLGLDSNLIELPGLTPGMLITLGEQKILTLNDFADLASDELTGTYDIINGEKVKIKGYLEDFALTRQEADNLIMTARNIIFKD